jgi:photosystem II stability/assembly factor-like uncharacterized protein
MKLILSVLLAALAMAQSPMGQLGIGPSWTPQDSGSTASLRGVSALSAKSVWASGTKGTYLHSTDGGASWQVATVPGAADLDFRAVWAVDEKTVYLLSIGDGAKSRVYKTSDAGGSWNLLYTNPDPKGFFDGLAFWDAAHGILVGDPVDGHFVIFTTDDGGQNWKRQKAPAALAKDGAFAASNSSLALRGTREAWLGTVGGRVLHSTDAGVSWSVAKTPIRKDSASSGIFSVAFSDARHGIAVGGDYEKAMQIPGNIAATSDGGKTWTVPAGIPPGGFRSAVTYLADRKVWIATGPSGSDVSVDDGVTWKQFDTNNYNAISFAGGTGWAVGPKGAIAKFSVQ